MSKNEKPRKFNCYMSEYGYFLHEKKYGKWKTIFKYHNACVEQAFEDWNDTFSGIILKYFEVCQDCYQECRNVLSLTESYLLAFLVALIAFIFLGIVTVVTLICLILWSSLGSLLLMPVVVWYKVKSRIVLQKSSRQFRRNL